MLKKNGVKLTAALMLGILVFALPRPEGTRFRLSGEDAQHLVDHVEAYFTPTPQKDGYIMAALEPGSEQATAMFLENRADALKLTQVRVDYVDGLSPTAKRFLTILIMLVFLFIFEPIPLEITAVLIGTFLVAFGISDVKGAWAPYMHPVVIFIMCCLIFAIALDRVGLTKRLGYYIIRKAGNSVTRFTFIISIGLGLASGVVHDAAATAIGIVTMLPLMRAVGIEPHTNTAKFMMLSLPFACSAGGMGTLVGGGRCMVSAAFLKEFTDIEITFFQWILYALPIAVVCVPAAVMIVYLVYRPEDNLELPDFDEELGPMTPAEKKTLAVIGTCFVFWLTKGCHGLDYSVTGMISVATLVLLRVLRWRDINDELEWGTALFIFGGGISLGLAMGYSGAADYFAHLFFPLVQGKGWLVLFVGMAVFGALVTNAMANVAAAALILPIVIPMAQLEGVDPTILALGLGMATSFAMLLVIGCPPNAIAYSYRYFKSSDLTKLGLVATPALLLILIGAVYVWWNIIGLI